MSNRSPTADLSDPICVLQCLADPSWKRSCNNCEKQRELEARLADAQNLVLSIENELIALRSSITEKNDPITNKFPPEITSHIFKLYVSLHAKNNGYLDSQRGFQEIPAGAALTLGAICRKWRTIVWSIPQLWTTLVVDLLSKGHAYGPDLAVQWFERTKGIGVDVRFHTGSRRHWSLKGHSEENVESTMKIFNRFLPQIRCLDMNDLSFNLASKLKDLGPEATSKLQRLCLGAGPGGHEEDVESSYEIYPQLFGGRYDDVHESSHCPTHVSLSCAIPFYQLNIRWTKVSHIELYRVTRATSFYIIEAAAQSLTHVTMMCPSDDGQADLDEDEWVPASPIELPLLIFLHIDEMYTQTEFTLTVFNSINVSLLKSLEYSGYGEERPMPVNAIITCIQRSSCSIEHLKLDWPAVQHITEIIHVLREMPELKSLDLTLASGRSVEPIFLELAHRDRGGATGGHITFLRNLEELKLNVFHPFDWMSFVNIWLAPQSILPSRAVAENHRPRPGTNHLISEENLKVDSARKKLSVSMVVRGELEPLEHYVGYNTLIALMRLSKDLCGSISVTADGETSRGVSKENEYNLLERSFLHHFPADSEYLPLLRSMKKTSDIQQCKLNY